MLPKSIRTQNGCWNCKYLMNNCDFTWVQFNCTKVEPCPVGIADGDEPFHHAVSYLRRFGEGEINISASEFLGIPKENAVAMSRVLDEWGEATEVKLYDICDEWEQQTGED